jgi:hypothetical protein
MSDYCKMKVLRIPFEDCNFGLLEDCDDLSYAPYEKLGGDVFYWGGRREGKFDFAPTERPFIDFVLEHVYGAECGEYGKVRDLYTSEKLKYVEVFQKLNPNVNMDNVKLVEFCWYNCSEAPDYYDPMDDEFYLEVPFICNFI